MGSDDARAVQRWQEGDATAFEALVRRWQRPVARLLARLVGPTELVQDLSQEVFLRVYRARDRYRENGTFTLWLYRIALNVARDAGRRRRPEAPLGEQQPADPRAPAEAVCQQREWVEAVTRALAELPRPLREVLVLHHYEALNFAEIARLTGTPASTVKSRFAAALKQLRARLQPLGWGPEETTS
jgi:RNA polymerase sigma-70 factor (ECF subfamily)